MNLLSKIGIFVENNKLECKKWFLIVVSSLTLNLSLFLPAISWIVFLFLIPIFYLRFIDRNLLSFKVGFVWGLFFYFIHLFVLIRLFFDTAQRSFGLLIPIILIMYFSIYSGFWLLLLKKIDSFFFLVFWTYFYFTWMRYFSFFVFGRFAGYPFSYPLLPLASHSTCLHFLGLLGQQVLLIFFIVFSVFISLFFATKCKRYAILAVLFFLPFLYGKINVKKDDVFPECIKNIGYLRPPIQGDCNYPFDVAQKIYYKMLDLVDGFKDIKFIVMPESSCRFSLNTNKKVLDVWGSNILGNDIDLLIGAHRKHGCDVYNSLYWISDGKIKKVYDKEHLVTFAEYIPDFLLHMPCIGNIFLENDDCFSQGKTYTGETFDLSSEISIEPYICSDIFLGRNRKQGLLSNRNNSIILLIVNDSVFRYRYMRRLMFLHAKLKALELQRDIIYVGYYYATWINKYGETRLLKSN